MTATVLAVIGTLCGSGLTGLLQYLLTGAARREDRADKRRTDQLAAVTALVSALADHRRAMWVVNDLRFSGADTEAVNDARARSHSTRAAITGPLTTIMILAPGLADAARRAAQASYDLRNAPDRDTLAQLRRAALASSDELIAASARLMAA